MENRKKLGVILISMALALQTAACGNAEPPANSGGVQNDRLPPKETQQSSAENQAGASENSNILIAYFTAAENSDVDVVSSASVTTVDGEAKGRLRAVADMIQAETGGTLFSIQTSVDYPGDGNAVEGTYSTYAEGTTAQELAESRSHRAFAGFSMGSVTTWHTFQYCMDYFRYFLPSSGNLTSDGAYMEQLVTDAGYGSEDFFIYAMSGTKDFAYAAFTSQIQAMLNAPDGIFIDADNENDGNLAYRVQEGNAHDGNAALQYIYNGLIWLWAEGQ